MGCTSCQDCGCDNVTLPVVTGPTGATGAAGADGADGADGSVILHNDVTRSTTTSSSLGLFSTSKEYDMPAGTLSTNGSKVKLTAIYSTTNIGAGEGCGTAVYFGGSNFTGLTYPLNISAWGLDTEAYLKVELDITRVDATTLFINADSFLADNGGNALERYHFTERAFTVSNMDNGSVKIDLRGSISASGTLNCDQLCIEQLIK